MSEFPTELRYSKDHEWAKLEGDLVRIGITHYAQESLGDVVYVELPSAGTQLEKGAAFGEVQSPKAVSDLYSPVSGNVAERNELLEHSPETVNSDPYGAGWMILVQSTDSAALDSLMDHAAYKAHVEGLEG